MKINWLISFLVLIKPCFTQITFRDSVSKEAINLVEIRDGNGNHLTLHQIGKKTNLSAYQNLELIAKHLDYRLKKFNAQDSVVYLNPYFQELKQVQAHPIDPLPIWDAIKRCTRNKYYPSDFYGKLKVKMQLSYLVKPDLNDYTYFDVYEKQKKLSLFDKKAPYRIANCTTEQESYLRFLIESAKEPEEVLIFYDNQDSICSSIVGNIGFNQRKTNRSERRFRHVYGVQDSLYYSKMVETSFINFYLSDQQEILLTELHPGTLPEAAKTKALNPKEVLEALPVKEMPYSEAPLLPARYYELFKGK